jgi:hypothetical protein
MSIVCLSVRLSAFITHDLHKCYQVDKVKEDEMGGRR